METETNADPVQRYPVETVVRFVEWVVQHHPDGARWSHLAVILRTYSGAFFYMRPSTRIVDLASSVAAGHGRC